MNYIAILKGVLGSLGIVGAATMTAAEAISLFKEMMSAEALAAYNLAYPNGGGDYNQFRHAYTSAKSNSMHGEDLAEVLG